ncbi:MAG: hypothetical protein RLP15_07185 [Cryomorphaceae bacterium]
MKLDWSRINWLKFMRLRGSAYLLSITVAVFFSLISASVLLYVRISLKQHKRIAKMDELFWHEKQTIRYLLSTDAFRLNKGEIRFAYQEVQDDSIRIERSRWGNLELIRTSLYNEYDSLKKAFLVGQNQTEHRVALYLSDQNRPLYLAGKSRLIGTCYLPKAGVRKAQISGRRYIGDQLVDGQTKVSERIMPELSELFGPEVGGGFDVPGSADTVEWKHSIKNSYWNETKILLVSESTALYGSYQGNLIIRSQGHLTIGASCTLDGVIVQAPSIRIKTGFVGTVQCFAMDSIILEEDVRLTYPSGLYVSNNTPGNAAFIEIQTRASVEGMVALDDKFQLRNQRSKLKVAEEAVISGMAYSNQYVQLEGEVRGSLYCKWFSLETASAPFDDHLLDACISSQALPLDYVQLLSLEGRGSRSIMQWLN